MQSKAKTLTNKARLDRCEDTLSTIIDDLKALRFAYERTINQLVERLDVLDSDIREDRLLMAEELFSFKKRLYRRNIFSRLFRWLFSKKDKIVLEDTRQSEV